MARVSKYDEHKHQVLELIENAARRHSRPPAVRVLADTLGVGVATMHSYLERMAQEGLVQWQPKRHHTLRAVPTGFPPRT